MRLQTTAIALSSALFLVACDDDDNTVIPPTTPEPEATTNIRVTHASSDAPLVAIKLNGEVVPGLEMVDYQQGTALLPIPAGTYDVGVDGLLAGDMKAVDVIAANLDFAPDMQYDIFAVGNLAAGEGAAESFGPVVLSRDAMPVDTGSVRLDVLHGHPGVPPVDIYLSTSMDITAEDPAVAGLAYKVDSMDLPVTVPAGTYRIRITVAGSKDVAFDSGELPLAGGSDLMVTAVPNTSIGATSPVNLLVGDGEAVNVVRSTSETANVRVVHAVADAPAVDVLASDTPVAPLTNIMFREFRSANVPAGSYDLKVAASADNSVVVIEAPGTEFMAGESTSIYATGSLAAGSIAPLVIPEDLRSVATYAKVRVTHASSLAQTAVGPVDLHASTNGTFSAETLVLPGVQFGDSAVLNVNEGTYQLAVIAPGDASYTPAIVTEATVANGGVYSAVATDDFAGGLMLNVDNQLAE